MIAGAGRGAGGGARDSISDTLCGIYGPGKGLPDDRAPVTVTWGGVVIWVFGGFSGLPCNENSFPLSSMDNVYFPGSSYLHSNSAS